MARGAVAQRYQNGININRRMLWRDNDVNMAYRRTRIACGDICDSCYVASGITYMTAYKQHSAHHRRRGMARRIKAYQWQ